jgi:hypothetical protein
MTTKRTEREYLEATLRGGEHEGNKHVHLAARARLAGKDYEHEDLSAQIDAVAEDLERKDEDDHAAAVRGLLVKGKKAKKS